MIIPRLIPYFLVISIVSILGCNVTADEKSLGTVATAEHLDDLSWVAGADAELDAAAAIARKDYRLWVLAGRGESAPGVSAEQAILLKAHCGVQYLKGSTDVVRDDQHMQLLKKAYHYAETYNQLMLPHCG